MNDSGTRIETGGSASDIWRRHVARAHIYPVLLTYAERFVGAGCSAVRILIADLSQNFREMSQDAKKH